MINIKSKPKLVCNITPVLITRYLFGFYFNFYVSKVICWFSRLFCICYASILLIFVYNMVSHPSILIKLWDMSEYFIFFLISISGKDEFLEKYYIFNTIIDDLPDSKQILWRFKYFFNAIIIIFTSLKCFAIIPLCIVEPSECENMERNVAFLILTAAVFVAQVFPILIYGLLYCRVKGICMLLEAKGFDNSPKCRLTPAKYMKMYRNVIDGWKKISSSIKLTTLLVFLGTAPMILTHVYLVLAVTKETGLDLSAVGWFMMSNITRFLCVIVPVIYVDLAMDQTEAIKAFLLEERFFCKHERLRAEIQDFLDYIENEPFHFNVCYMMPMNLQCMIMTTSFCFSTLMAVLQINYNLSTDK